MSVSAYGVKFVLQNNCNDSSISKIIASLSSFMYFFHAFWPLSTGQSGRPDRIEAASRGPSHVQQGFIFIPSKNNLLIDESLKLKPMNSFEEKNNQRDTRSEERLQGRESAAPGNWPISAEGGLFTGEEQAGKLTSGR